MTTTSPPVARSGLPPRGGGAAGVGGRPAGAPDGRRGDLPRRGHGQERRAHGGEVLRPARRDADGAADPADRPAALAGPPPRHGPAHALAPLGRLHAVLDRRYCTPRSSSSATPRLRRGAGADRRSSAWPASSRRSWACSPPRIIVVVAATVGAVPPAAGCPTRPGTPSTCWSTLAILLALIHQLYEGTTFTVLAAGHRLLVDGCGRSRSARCCSAGSSLPCGATPGTSSGWPRSCRSPTTSSRSTSPAGDLHRLPARAGQFFIWRFPGHNRWWQANPFSLSAAPDGRYAPAHRQGRRHHQRGPARRSPSAPGCSPRARTARSPPCTGPREATLLIAGGVGVTPIRALLGGVDLPDRRALPGARASADAVLLRRAAGPGPLRGARAARAGRAHRPGNPPNTPFDPRQPRRAGARHRATATCSSAGPTPMTDAVLRSLRVLKVPRAQVHAERFSLA